jgi:hypothetical protein
VTQVTLQNQLAKPVGFDDMVQYKQEGKELHSQKVDDTVCNIAWEFLWQKPCDDLLKYVKSTRIR